MDCVSSFRIINEREKLEEGVGLGVARIVVVTFWQQLFAATMVSDKEKLPCIHHDFQKSEWTAIGRVLELKQYPEFSSLTGLDDFSSARMPSAKKTARMPQSQPENEAKTQCLDYLKKFIRSLDAPALGTFLKFTMESDIQPEHQEVSFTSMDGELRRPIACTCGPLLELPRTYRNYTELAEEFTNLLREKGARACLITSLRLSLEDVSGLVISVF